jgi:endonuclease/exonuclease/phosphatase (EEP) superfamily protein YafD
MKKSTTVFLIVVFILTLISYSSVLISPQIFRISGFISLSIPFFLVLNLILVIFYLIKVSKKAFLPIASLIIGFKFILITIPLISNKVDGSEFSVLSYNVKWLVETQKGGGFDKALDWLASDEADIKCFQEFNARKNIVNSIKKQGEFESVVGGRGNTLAIFTKGKIFNSGLLFSEENINNVLYADILIDSDTIRVYNVHLESMGIELNEMSTSDEVSAAYNKLKSKFVNGSVQRAGQIDELLKHAEKCNYPVIISGDFNDVPYSYNYFELKANFNNAFENVGKGFGFTFNGGLPFLRIDNQFYNSRLKAHNFQTLRDVFYSDHYPVKGSYSLPE